MDTTARRRKLHKTIIGESLNSLYPHDLNLYQLPPNNVINLTEFEDLAIERLQLLRIIEQASIKNHKPYTDDWRQCIKEDLTKLGLKKYVRLMSGLSGNTEHDIQARRADHISHFILRLAYCRSDELRRWFLARELEWFRLRFSVQTHQSIKKFLQLNNLTYTAISDDEKEQIKEELIASTGGYNAVDIESSEFYKVPFVEVCSLVKNRKVYLKLGFAYVPSSELVICVLSQFRAKLNESLSFYHRRMPMFDDERINPLLENLHNAYTGKSYNFRADKDKEIVDVTDIDNYSKQHFPLCMRHIHGVLRTNHHLKHGCRLQYGLFLKGIGLTLDDAMQFWREEFTKIMDSNKFDKEHVYNIKHLYGKVGNMTNYSPFSCMKIIMDNVGAGEHHGCPFKLWDPAILKQKLTEYGFSSESVEEIRELATNGHYQVACTKYFEVARGKPPSTGINHPNQYFEESFNLEKANKIKK